MTLLKDLYNARSELDFRPLWKKTLPIAFGLMVVSLALIGLRGLNRSIEFEGGGLYEVPVAADVSVADARGAAGIAEARVQKLSTDSGDFIRIQVPTEALEDSESIVDRLSEISDGREEISISEVGPTWGGQITNSAIRALLLFFVAVAIYLAWRMEWRMAFGAIVAVIHDLVVTTGVYALLGFEVSPSTVIALLTILGYSLYDTVVVYDKVLENYENERSVAKGYLSLINQSMNQVLMRSVNTTITTVLPVLSMLLIGVFFLGGDSLRGFALALFIGLLLGTYSSLFLAAPLLGWLKERQTAAEKANG